MGIGIIRLKSERVLILRNRLIQFALPMQSNAESVAGFGDSGLRASARWYFETASSSLPCSRSTSPRLP